MPDTAIPDLTPRPAPEAALRRARPRWTLVVGLVLVAAAAFVVYQGLTNASLYFRNADAAVAERDSLGERRFRLQGAVVSDEVESDGDAVVFQIIHNGVTVEVHHRGDPPELFQSGIPVVLEGRWSALGDWFESDRMLVKHTSDYVAENPVRVSGYDGASSDDDPDRVGDSDGASARSEAEAGEPAER